LVRAVEDAPDVRNIHLVSSLFLFYW
jgi:hypothetical protein